MTLSYNFPHRANGDRNRARFIDDNLEVQTNKRSHVADCKLKAHYSGFPNTTRQIWDATEFTNVVDHSRVLIFCVRIGNILPYDKSSLSLDGDVGWKNIYKNTNELTQNAQLSSLN